MILAWMVYALLVGILAGAAAWVLEALLRSHRRPARWVWLGALLFSVLWPLVTALRPPNAGASHTGSGGQAPAVLLEPLTLAVEGESSLRALDEPLVVLWVGLSGLFMTLALLLLLRTHWLRKRWTGEEAGGRRVLFSENWGPAVVGFFRPQIVLPRWSRNLDEKGFRLILDHEAEHLRAGDLRLQILAGLLPLLLPWNLPLWWQWRRLRVAAEGDCDLRVLRQHPRSTRAYLDLLLEVGHRLSGERMAAAMLSEPERSLRRRIQIMTMPLPKRPWVRGVLLSAVGAGLIAVACWAPGPTDLEENAVSPAPTTTRESPAAGSEDLAAEPTFTPYTVRPDIKNRREIQEAMIREYPPLLRDAGIGGQVGVWFFIDETGTVGNIRIAESSGHQALDEAALRVAEVPEFTPALNRDEPVPVWISLPITFSADSDSGTEGSDAGGSGQEAPPRVPVKSPGQTSAEEIGSAPTFTPYTVRPDIKNRREIQEAMIREYPPLLRDAGIGGQVGVWFFIDETGTVGNIRIAESSGHQALDEAALRVAEVLEFTPALNKDDPVPVWISLPITFETR